MSRVRSSLDTEVFANIYQVVIAITDVGSYNFEENIHGSFTCS